MAEYNEEDYYEILLTSIRGDKTVPFDVYILLKANGRIVHFIKRDEPFPKEVHEKLSGNKVKHLHIKRADQKVYDGYLKQFFETEEGKAVLEDLVEKSDGDEITGVPDNVLEQFGSVIDYKKKKKSEEVEGYILEKPTKKDKDAIEENKKLHADIIAQLKEGVEGLDKNLQLHEKVSDAEYKIIKEATEVIDSELQKVKSRSNGEWEHDKQIVKGAREVIEKELIKLAGVADSEDNLKHRELKHYVKSVKNDLDRLTSDEANSKDHEKVLGNSIDLLNQDMWGIKQLYQDEDKEVLNDAVSKMVESVEGLLGKSLDLQSTNDGNALQYVGLVRKIMAGSTSYNRLLVKVSNSPPVLSKAFGKIYPIVQELYDKCTAAVGKELPDAEKGSVQVTDESPVSQEDVEAIRVGKALKKYFDQDPKIAKRLAETVAAQKKTIDELRKKLGRAKVVIKGAKEKIKDFAIKVEPNLQDNEKIVVQNVTDKIDQLEDIYDDSEKMSKNLDKTSHDLYETVGIRDEAQDDESDEEKGESEKKESGTKNIGGNEQRDGDTVVKEMEKEQAELNLAPPESTQDSNDIDAVKSENRVLRSQLEDARSLITSNDKKIRELAKNLGDNSNYIEKLEVETSENQKTITILKSKMSDTDSKNDRLMEAVNDSDRLQHTAKNEIKSRDDKILDLNDRINFLEQELKFYSSNFGKTDMSPQEIEARAKDNSLPPEAVHLFAEKDKIIRKHLGTIEEKKKEAKNLKREIIKLQSTAQNVNIMKKQMNQKFEKLKIESDMSRKSQESMNRKVHMVSNLLEESRKTISKLTSVNQELRAERMVHMSKTAEALRNFKEMMSKANQLDSHVQAEMQRNRNLGEQNEAIKAKQRELATRFADLQKRFIQLENENRRMKKSLDSGAAGGTGLGASPENNPIVLRQRLDEAAKARDVLVQKYKAEQTKVADLQRQLKALNAKLMAGSIKKSA